MDKGILMLSEAAIKEYRKLKEKYPEGVILLQVGAFYKILLDDARRWAGELCLKLITINNPDSTGKMDGEIAFCGFPESGLDKYAGRLVRQGSNIIICNQIKENGKIVKWEVKERIILDGRLSE